MVKATNCLARRAFDIGVEWSYRLNDDSWLQTANWGNVLTSALSERSHRTLPAVLKSAKVNGSVSPIGTGARQADRLREPVLRRPVLGVTGPFCPDGKQWTFSPDGKRELLVMDLVRRRARLSS